MDEYTPTLDEVRDFCVQWGKVQHPHIPERKTVEAFERFLADHDRVVAANAWDEGFDAGERDVLEHEAGNFDSPCIPNPYRITEENN